MTSVSVPTEASYRRRRQGFEAALGRGYGARVTSRTPRAATRPGPLGAVRRGVPVLGVAGVRELRGPDGPDRAHAHRARRTAPMDRRGELPPRAQLRDAAPRPRGPPAGDLRGLAAQRDARGARRGGVLPAPGVRADGGSVLDLRRPRRRHLDRRASSTASRGRWSGSSPPRCSGSPAGRSATRSWSSSRCWRSSRCSCSGSRSRSWCSARERSA